MMYAPRCAIVVFSILLVLAATDKSDGKKGSLDFVTHDTERYSDQDIEQHIPKNEAVSPRVQYDEDPLLPTFIQNMIDRFYHQREAGRAQFGFLVLGNPDESILTMNAIPNDGHGNPIVDNTQPLSPANPSLYVNYVAARPETVPQLEDAIHAEDHLLGELRRLWNNYRNYFRQTPAFMLLYSWIMPCPDCTNLILNYFQAAPFVHVDRRYVVHSTEGLSLPYMSPESNDRSRQLLRNAGIGVLTHNCFSLPPALKGPSTMSRPLANVQKTTTPRNVAVDTLDKCYEAETMQGCLIACLMDDICCCCEEGSAMAMKVSFINEFMSKCAKERLSSLCVDQWISRSVGNACGCHRISQLQSKLKQCIRTCNSLQCPISNPVDPRNPPVFTGILQDIKNLAHFPHSVVACKDKRMEGLLCSHYNREFITAGNSLCRQDHKCGKYGESFSWCYTDYSNNWDYCCTDSCATRGENYLWCHSGSRWQYCGDAGMVNVVGRHCLPSSPCGLHLDVNANTNYYWCYEDNNKNWQYCCQPTCPCNWYSEGYTWCYTGYKLHTKWQYCKK